MNKVIYTLSDLQQVLMSVYRTANSIHNQINTLTAIASETVEAKQPLMQKLGCETIKQEYTKIKDTSCGAVEQASVNFTATLFLIPIVAAINLIFSLVLVTWKIVPK